MSLGAVIGFWIVTVLLVLADRAWQRLEQSRPGLAWDRLRDRESQHRIDRLTRGSSPLAARVLAATKADPLERQFTLPSREDRR